MPQPTIAPGAQSGSKTGLIVALVAVIAALGVGGYFGYRLLFPETGESTITPTQAPATAPSQPADAAKDSTIVSPAQPAATDSTSTQQAAPVTPPADEAKSGGGAEAAKSAGGASKADSTKAKAALAPPAAPKGTTTAPPAEPAPPRVAAPAAPSSAPPVAGTPSDRWKQMAEAMAQCHREDFFSRVGCEQRVGRRFCDGYWGTVPQCPSGVPKDRGQ